MANDIRGGSLRQYHVPEHREPPFFFGYATGPTRVDGIRGRERYSSLMTAWYGPNEYCDCTQQRLWMTGAHRMRVSV